MECNGLDTLDVDYYDGVDACCSNGSYAAFAGADGIKVIFTDDVKLPILHLQSTQISHQYRVGALHIQHGVQMGRVGRSQLLPHQASQTLLAAATRQGGTLVWVLEEAYAQAAAGAAPGPPARLIPQHEEAAAAFSAPAVTAAEAVQFSRNGLLAVGSNNSVIVWDLQQLEVVHRLEGHQGTIKALMFSPQKQHLLISTAEDRCFKVWDLHAGQLLYESSVLGACVPYCMAVDSTSAWLAIGYADATVRLFDLTLLPACHSKQVIDASKMLQQVAAAATQTAAACDRQQAGGPQRITSSVKPWRQQLQHLVAATTGNCTPADGPAAAAADITLALQDGAGCVLSLQFVQHMDNQAAASAGSWTERTAHHGTQLLHELLSPLPQLLVCTRHGLLMVNLASGEAERCWVFGSDAGNVWASVGSAATSEAGCTFDNREVSTLPLSISQLQQPAAQQQQQLERQLSCFRALPAVLLPAAACCFVTKQQPQQSTCRELQCCIATNSTISLVQLTAADPAAQQHLSIFQTQHLPPNSPLRAPGWSGLPENKRPGSGNATSGSGSSSSSTAARSTSLSANAATSSSRLLHCQTTAASMAAKPARSSAGIKATKAKLKDLPVTFHKQVKSAGYGFVQPKIKLGQAKPAAIKIQPGCSKVPQLLSQQFVAQRQYPVQSEAPTVHQVDLGLPQVHNGGILRVEFAGDGCRLLTGSSDHTARCMSLPLAKHVGAGTTFLGHIAPVNCICWSHSGEHILTASADRTARLWSCARASPLITFNGLHQQASAAVPPINSRIRKAISKSSSSSSSKVAARPLNSTGSTMSAAASLVQNQEFLAEVTAARFFRLDEFVLLATGNKLHMYRYKLAEAPVDDDIQRLKSCGSCSLAGSYSSSCCQSILDVASANSFMSTLVILACSNRSIELVDAATLQVARRIPDAHGRSVQRLAQPPASPFVSHPHAVHELFASSAPDGVIKVWDVRSSRCVRSFTGHKNSSQQVPVGVAFSPCMRLLATGSEDHCAYLYDLRTCTQLYRLRPPGQADMVADVAFHPSRPQLVAACMNGQLSFYSDG